MRCATCLKETPDNDHIIIELKKEGKDVCFCSWFHADAYAVRKRNAYIFPVHPTPQ